MASMKRTNSMFPAYILNKTIDVNTKGYQIPILWSPTSVSESVNASFDQQNIPGRSAPVISYSYTGARQVSISFTVTADYLPPGFSSVADYCNCIKALEYPKYEAAVVTSPNSSLHLPNVDVDGVCSSVAIEYKTDRYTRDRGQSAEISLTFLEVMESIKGSINIITGSQTNTGEVSGSGTESDLIPRIILLGAGQVASNPDTLTYTTSTGAVSYSDPGYTVGSSAYVVVRKVQAISNVTNQPQPNIYDWNNDSDKFPITNFSMANLYDKLLLHYYLSDYAGNVLENTKVTRYLNINKI